MGLTGKVVLAQFWNSPPVGIEKSKIAVPEAPTANDPVTLQTMLTLFIC